MRRFFASVLIFAALTGISSAQTPLPPPPGGETPTVAAPPVQNVTPQDTPAPTETLDPDLPVQPLDLSIATDVLFPAGVAFRLDFNTPDTGIEALTAVAAQEGWAGQRFAVDPAQVVSADGRSTLSYLWEIPDAPPALFVPLTLTWTVVPRGAPGESIEVEVVLADPRYTWTLTASSDAPMTAAQTESRGIVGVFQSVTASLAEVLEAGGRDIIPLNVVVFPPNALADPCRINETLTGVETGMNIPCESARAARIYAAAGWLPLETSAAVPFQFALTETVLRAAYPGVFAAAPAWFQNGVTGYFSGTYSLNDLENARAVSRSGGVLASLDTVPAAEAEKRQWRTQSTGTVIYMASQIGIVPLLDLMHRVDSGETLGAVWQALSGQQLSGLPGIWRNWIFTVQGEAAYALLPSLAPTPTLVPSRTFTPTHTFTPSPTLTATPTPTLTPTLTLTPSATLYGGFAYATAVPTLTPSVTPLPTITARPAEVFVLGTVSDENPEPSSSRPLVIAGLAAAAVAMLLAIATLILRKR